MTSLAPCTSRGLIATRGFSHVAQSTHRYHPIQERLCLFHRVAMTNTLSVAMCRIVLQSVAMCCSVPWHMVATLDKKRPFVRKSIGRGHHREKMYCSMLQCIAVRRSMLQYIAVWCSVLQCVAVPKEGAYPHECVAVCCNLL